MTSAEGQQPYANFKTVYFVIYLSSFMTDFHETSLTWILLMRQSKWGATTLISWLILMDFYKPSLTGIPLIRQHNERQQPYANFKTAHVVKYIGSFLMDLHKTSITGILLRDDLNEEQQPYANFKTAYFVIYLSSFMTDFHENSITGNLLMRWSKWGAIILISWLHFDGFSQAIIERDSFDKTT